MSENTTPQSTTRTIQPARQDASTTIGPYRLQQKIGEGGMGEVWAAEQTVPVRRKVALKLIKWGMDTKAVVARFEAERQALALMNHPNVARVYDAGATEAGRPYFVMELVQGIPITDHCDRARLSVRERLELFTQVCDGVQHAHQKAIIHRDLKPSNIIVAIQDEKAVPKIIDFGVAKATDQRLTEATIFTEYGQLIGTPEYMSPEQAEMTIQDVDTRTDVYSLGVMLYELLVGVRPFDSMELMRASFDEIRRKIREDEPSKPSARVSTLGGSSVESARKRRVDPRTLQRELRGDLDWIVMRALEKQRTRRYDSPRDLAEDIRRSLRREPVHAGPPSWVYRLRRFGSRNSRGLALAAVSVVALIALSAAIATINAQRLESYRKEETSALAAVRSRSLSGEAAPWIRRIESRILAANGSEADHDAFMKAFLKIEWSGRVMQQLPGPFLSLNIGNRSANGLRGGLGILIKEISLFLDGGAAAVDDFRPQVLRPMYGAGLSVGFEVPISEIVGTHKLKGSLTACLVPIPDSAGKNWGTEPAERYGKELRCQTRDAFLDVPPFSITVVGQLPAAYPLPIDDPKLVTWFIEHVRFGTVALTRRGAGSYEASVEVNLPDAPIDTLLDLELLNLDGSDKSVLAYFKGNGGQRLLVGVGDTMRAGQRNTTTSARSSSVGTVVAFEIPAAVIDRLRAEGRTTFTFALVSNRTEVLRRTEFDQFLVLNKSWNVPFRIEASEAEASR